MNDTIRILYYYLMSAERFPEKGKEPPYFLLGKLSQTVYTGDNEAIPMVYVVWDVGRRKWQAVSLEQDEIALLIPITARMSKMIRKINILCG